MSRCGRRRTSEIAVFPTAERFSSTRFIRSITARWKEARKTGCEPNYSREGVTLAIGPPFAAFSRSPRFHRKLPNDAPIKAVAIVTVDCNTCHV